MHKFDIDLKNISKIEGHTHLEAKVRGGKVQSCKLKITEGKRFFREAVIGKSYKTVGQTMSRICGTCSSAHALGSIEAVEKALGIKVSRQTILLRNLLSNAGHLRDHAMHLYFFCLPDILGFDSVLDFDENNKEQHELIHDALDVKEAGNVLCAIVGGRAVHPPNAVVGGFSKFPKKKDLLKAKEKLEECRDKIIKIIDVFHKRDEKFNRKINYAGLINKDYNFLEGKIKTSEGVIIGEKDYDKHLQEVVLPYSSAEGAKWKGKDFMVGALARINVNKESLHKKTQKDVKEYLKEFPSDNIFHNNLAQAIECLHIIDSSIDMIDKVKDSKKEKPAEPKIEDKDYEGVGVVEAPRGTLYYKIKIDGRGIVTDCDLCIPTQQNIIHMEKGIAKYIESMLDEKSKNEISMGVEKMIRAYDPCMSCATHFLKIDWI